MAEMKGNSKEIATPMVETVQRCVPIPYYALILSRMWSVHTQNSQYELKKKKKILSSNWYASFSNSLLFLPFTLVHFLSRRLFSTAYLLLFVSALARSLMCFAQSLPPCLVSKCPPPLYFASL